MAEIVHRYVNGTAVSFDDLSHYRITNRTILEIISHAARRGIHTSSTNELSENTFPINGGAA